MQAGPTNRPKPQLLQQKIGSGRRLQVKAYNRQPLPKNINEPAVLRFVIWQSVFSFYQLQLCL